MSCVCLKDKTYHTLHDLPKIGQKAPSFTVTKTDLSTVNLDDFSGKSVLINVYPSIDTEVCFGSTQEFQKMAKHMKETIVLCISMDLPFALKRVTKEALLHNILLLSDFRNREFGDLYGLTITNGPLAGLLARCVIVLDKNHRIIYHELVADIATPPNYEAAIASLAID